MVKTTIRLPRDLWREARIQALDEQTNFQAVLTKALKDYLQAQRKRRGGGK